MARFGFCGPSYTSQSPNADDERCLNWYPELIEGSGKGQYALYPTPGLSLTVALGTNASVDAMIVCPSPTGPRAFAISGTGFYEVGLGAGFQGGGALRGTFSSNVFHQPSMTYGQGNGGSGSVLIAIDGNAYYFILATNTFSAVSINAATISLVGYCDGFFLACVYRSSTVYQSNTLDVTTWVGTNFTAVSVFPDPIVQMVVNQRQVWFWGTTACQPYYSAGDFPFNFDVIQGAYIESGCVSSFNSGQFMNPSACKLDNSIFWVGADQRGQGMIWRANGYTPQRVSNHAVEYAMQSYSTINDVFLYPYQDQGHSFLVCYFPSANGNNGATWVYDVATGQWHERCFLNPVNGQEYAHRSKCHVFISGSGQLGHYVGDWQPTGNIYQMQIATPNGSSGWNFATDFGNPIKRLRRAPHINLEKEWMHYQRLDLDMETGLGPIPPLPGTSNAPIALYLASPNGTVYEVQITSIVSFQVTAAPLGSPVSQNPILNDYQTNTQSWEVSVPNGGGGLTYTSVPYNVNYPQVLPMLSQITPGVYQLTGIRIPTGATGPQNAFIVTPYTTPNADPQVMLRMSRDDGHTWGNQRFKIAGQAGKFQTLVFFTRLGRARSMIFEVECTDPIPWRMVDAYLKASPAYGAEERLVKKLAKSA